MSVARTADNERRVCDAIARVLESRMVLARKNAICPEKERDGPPIDYSFDLGDRNYAIEHTRVEAFERQLHSGIDFSALVGPIEEALSAQMPSPGTYSLTFPIDPCVSVKRKDLAKIQDAIVPWAKQAALELHTEAPARQDKKRMPHGYRGVRKAKLEGVPFEVTLRRDLHWAESGEADGKLFVQRWAPEGAEDLRRARIKTALDKKLPKLAQCKAEGAVSVLVLESDDIALTNYALVAEAIEAEIANHEHRPDEIFFVDTTIVARWTVWSLRRGEVLFPDEETQDRYREFNPTELHDV